MPGESAVNKIPYPLDADAPDGPSQMKAMADLLDTLKWGSRNLRPSLGAVQASSDLVLSESFADVTGTTLELEPAVESKLFVVAFFYFSKGAAFSSGSTFKGTIRLDSTDQAPEALWMPPADGSSRKIVVPQGYVLTLASGKRTIKMRACASNNPIGEEEKALATHTRFLYAMFAA